ncbi:MAG: stilbene synthase [Opitutales bacterium]|jgi:predicted naringenin-chalcone synthase|nr:stilbene synthase [Opitutales bacterium]MDP4645258.1 stilbene synthase [Opitutales bacterium]MDP4776318.1 stilbene synthase [Opitutales bacterium]MDP4884545.1 stilbene synthase [Opitutales bacterium]MDP4884649.1 stilbene synthase [Opitutales bacterium]
MYLQSISRAVPKASYTQSECWDILTVSPEFNELSSRAQTLLQKVLQGDTGIQKRHFATQDVSRLFSLDAQTLNQNFEQHAPALSEEALRKALDRAQINAAALDALFICTCTGYLCPGLSSYVAEALGLSNRTYLQDIVGLGCGAAIPTIRSAEGFLAANPQATVACIAVEICSAAFYLDNDPGVLISACLFGDGASATIWSNNSDTTGYRIQNFDTIHKPEARELLRFTNKAGKLRNQLDRTVPEVAAPVVRELYTAAGITPEHQIAAHVGGRDVLLALEAALPKTKLSASWKILRDYGNISSPSVLFALEDILYEASPPANIWLTSFGAGFAAHSCELTLKE